jgi:TIR domain
MKLFLSYAEEDKAIAGEIGEWLRTQSIEFYDWHDPMREGGRFIEQIEEAMDQSYAFLALLSPSFLASRWCRRERHLALQREQDLQASEPDYVFVNVLQVIATPSSGAGFLRSYGWVDLTNPENKNAALGSLASRLGSASERELARLGPAIEPELTTHEATISNPPEPLFRNREDELERVLRGLTNAGGIHFWLVIAPPQLGKTWFLRRVKADVASSESTNWATRLVDLRAQPLDVRSDAAALLACLFGLSSPVTIDEETLLSIAQEISRSGKPYLCLLDSAELLDPETAATLRSCLGQIHHFVQDARRNGVRLAFIVASRREDEWRGVTPSPRLSPLRLTEFTADVVQQALDELALGRTFSSEEFRKKAALVHRLTEGLPALLVECLQWIDAEEWLRMERLDGQELFEQLADPYIQKWLLTPDSLFPGRQGQANDPLYALEQAYRVLAPYRLFTQSHLRHHLESDPAFSAALQDQRWSMGDLWMAISGTALLLRPLNEPWQEIHAAIRRLLYRYYYTSDEHRIRAHREARKFVGVWADQLSGKEQVIGLVECLWHEAVVLRLSRSAQIGEALSDSAKTLSQALRPSLAYTLAELRAYAAERMRNDEEFQETLGNVNGLFNKLVEIVVSPPRES